MINEDWTCYPVDTELIAALKKPGKGFLKNVESFGDDLVSFIQHHLYAPQQECRFTVSNKGVCSSLPWMQGTHFDPKFSNQLRQADVMLVGPCPRVQDFRYNFALDSYQALLEEMFSTTGFQDFHDWYFTYLVKFTDAEREGKQLKAGDVTDCRPFFEQELKRVRPSWIIACGKYAAGVLLGKKGLSSEQMIGTVYAITYTCADGTEFPLKVLGVPALSDTQDGKKSQYYQRIFRRQMEYFYATSRMAINISDGKEHRVFQAVEESVNHRHIIMESPEELTAEVNRIMELAKEDPKRCILAVDMEWEGAYPEEPGAELLTIQFSSAPGEAAVMVLSSHAMKEEHREHSKAKRNAIVEELNRLLTWHGDWHPRVGGHFLRADLPWLLHLGLTGIEDKDILWSYMAPKKVEQCRWHGGWDTSLMYHAYSEKDSYGLKYLASRELDTPIWNQDLNDFLAEHKRERKPLTGFGCVPDTILHPYAAWDADATRRLAELMMFGYNGRPALLDGDEFGNPCWRPYFLAHRAAPGFLEMERTGLLMDRERFADLSKSFYQAYHILLTHFRNDVIGWPDFNPGSTPHKQALLFGEDFGTTYTEKNGFRKSLPEGVRSLNLLPVYESRDKRLWEEIRAEEGSEFDPAKYSPSTDKNVMDLLAQASPEAAMLRDLGKLKHTLDGVLSVSESYWDRQGFHTLYPKGHFKHIRNDGTIHSHMSQLLATGRAASSKPNMQNIGKSSEEALKDILGHTEEIKKEDGTCEVVCKGRYMDILQNPYYLYPIRTMYRAPKDHVLVEADFTGAELAVMAWVSQDPTMMDHVRRNALEHDDPEYYDIHSHIAVSAFRLDCEPTKEGLASIGKKHLRVAAKTVAFGIPYGRGARMIAFQLRAQGIPITTEEAKTIINSYFEMYPQTRNFLNACKAAVQEKGYVETLFGRYRRFRVNEYTSEDLIAKMQREFCNAPIQGSVADAVNVAIYNLIKARYATGLRFRIVMQIHDALLLCIHKDDCARMWNHVIPDAMTTDNPILVNGKEYHFAIEKDLAVRWGELITEKTKHIAIDELGVTLEYLTKDEV